MYRPVLTRFPHKVLLLASVLMLCVTVPYCVPVQPSVGLSYIAQFNNRVCTIVFLIGAIAFATLTGGNIGECDAAQADRPLSFRSLVLALTLLSPILWVQCFVSTTHKMGSEAGYNINRVQMLVQHLRPYRDFEYAYGPLHLYLPYLLFRLFHCTAVTAYYLWLSFEWIAGIGMIWFIVRAITLPLRWRTLLFWSVFLTNVAFGLEGEGTAYTPFRTVGAAFWLLLVYVSWTRYGKPRVTVLLGVFAVLFSLGIAPDQAVGVSSGLLVWFLFLTCRGTGTNFPRSALFTFLAAILPVFLLAARANFFSTMLQFSMGAYCFPLLPSIPVFTLLIAYMCAPCAVASDLRHRRFGSESIPLAAGGLALMPAALGRCDLGHLQLAFPALILGVAFLLAHRLPRVAWATAILLVVVVPAVFAYTQRLMVKADHVVHARLAGRGPKSSSTIAGRTVQEIGPPPTRPGPAVAMTGSGPRIQLAAPCPVLYRTPNLSPGPNQTPQQACLDTGYYDRWLNVFTPEAIDRKIAELAKQPRLPLLLRDAPLPQQLAGSDQDL